MIDDKDIVVRFFGALDALKESGCISGIKGVCDRYGIDRRNIYKLRAEPSRKIFSPSWLAYLVSDYGVSAHWLLTGDGSVFTAQKCK